MLQNFMVPNKLKIVKQMFLCIQCYRALKVINLSLNVVHASNALAFLHLTKHSRNLQQLDNIAI